jgi:hypothetical protein
VRVAVLGSAHDAVTDATLSKFLPILIWKGHCAVYTRASGSRAQEALEITRAKFA